MGRMFVRNSHYIKSAPVDEGAAIERNNLIIKTVMINWELSDEH